MTVYGEKEDALANAVDDTTGDVLLESEARDILKHLEAQGWELVKSGPCAGCKYYHRGSKDCMLSAPNNCIRQAEDYYTKGE